ncbi:hypothetical protein [Mycolicibacterium vinylchloridicum]|uniref:hypothetical protein n=1 Tax=Mycolicibacterium vinylchloridicum TaxID=2736928 RepID=UPI0015CC9956|nr:hypothetical protein [Mycolicibacterium vinylchloridicum]
MDGLRHFWATVAGLVDRPGSSDKDGVTKFGEDHIAFLYKYALGYGGVDLPQFGTPIELVPLVPEGGMAKYSAGWCALDINQDNTDVMGVPSYIADNMPNVHTQIFDLAENKNPFHPLRDGIYVCFGAKIAGGKDQMATALGDQIADLALATLCPQLR